MLGDVENLAVPDLAPGAGEEEIKAAAMEDVKTMDGYLRELRGMEPPHELLPLRDELTGLFRSVSEAASALEAALTAEDLSPLDAYLQWFAGARESLRELRGEGMSYLGGMGATVDRYIERGKQLAARIHGL